VASGTAFVRAGSWVCCSARRASVQRADEVQQDDEDDGHAQEPQADVAQH
jgi:hypothetical protein